MSPQEVSELYIVPSTFPLGHTLPWMTELWLEAEHYEIAATGAMQTIMQTAQSVQKLLSDCSRIEFEEPCHTSLPIFLSQWPLESGAKTNRRFLLSVDT